MILVRAFYDAIIIYLPTFVLYFLYFELVTEARITQDLRNISNHLLMSKTVFIHPVVLQVVCDLCVLAPHHLSPPAVTMPSLLMFTLMTVPLVMTYDAQTGKTKTCFVIVRRLKVIAPRRW